MSSIILMGIKHCGKSTQGRLINAITGMPFYDTDDVIAELTGKSPRQIFSESGEEAFMKAETEASKYIVEQSKNQNKDFVIATGGGICNNYDALQILHQAGKFIYLQVPEFIACSRILNEADFSEKGNIKNLPAYIAKKNPATKHDVKTIFHSFFEERTRIYLGIADMKISVGSKNKKENARRILKSAGINLDLTNKS